MTLYEYIAHCNGVGAHDDLVLSVAITLWMATQGPVTSTHPIPLILPQCGFFVLVRKLIVLKDATFKVGAIMVYRTANCLLAVIAIGLSGCTGVPELDIPSPVTVADIIDRIQCEAYQAADRNPRYRTERWAGAADLYLTVDDNAGFTPSLTYIEPLATAGTSWALGVSGTVRRARQRVYNESITFEMSTLSRRSCDKIVQQQYDLTGDLGIVETLGIAAVSFDQQDKVKFAEKQAVGQTLQFVLTKNIGGGPTWSLKHFIGVGPILGAERIDTHKLLVSFAPGATTKTVITSTGEKKTVVTGGGGADAALGNNSKLLLNSIPNFQPLR